MLPRWVRIWLVLRLCCVCVLIVYPLVFIRDVWERERVWVGFCSRCELNVESKSSIFLSGSVELFFLVNSFLQSQTNKVSFFCGFWAMGWARTKWLFYPHLSAQNGHCNKFGLKRKGKLGKAKSSLFSLFSPPFNFKYSLAIRQKQHIQYTALQ